MSRPDQSQPGESPERIPISFKLTLVMAAIYLTWRLVEGLIALYRWIF